MACEVCERPGLFSLRSSPDEDHFSPEADAAVSEMTRGAVLVAQVQNMSGDLLLVALLVLCTLCHMKHEARACQPGSWEILGLGASICLGLGRDEYSLLFLMQAG